MKAKVTVKENGNNVFSVVCEVPYRGTTIHEARIGSDGRGLWIDGRQAATPAAFDARQNPAKEVKAYFLNYFLPPAH